ALSVIQRPGAAAPELLDAPALAGAVTTPDMWADRSIGLSPDGWGYFLQDKLNDAGYQSICTPGTVRHLATLLARHGTLSWERAIEPAARVAEHGFVVDTALAGGGK